MSADKFFDDDGSDVTLAAVAPLTDRVNSEPPILKGLSATETLIAMAVFFPLWFIVGGIFAFASHHWQVLMLMGVIGPMVSVWVMAGYFAKLKRNRPDHYYRHAAIWWLHRFGLYKAPFIALLGAWDVGRSLVLIVEKKQSLSKRLSHALGLAPR